MTTTTAATRLAVADGEKAGLVRLQDLTEDTPMFDLRVRASWRGRGLGKAAVNRLTDYLFTEFPEVMRIEGTTRQDNRAMRAIFLKCGYAKESHYGTPGRARRGSFDSVGTRFCGETGCRGR